MIGPTFYDELVAAGLAGLPFSWGTDGALGGRQNLTAAQNATLDAVIAAHNPTLQSAATIRLNSFNADATRADLLTQLQTATPAQINTYVDNNVIDLASARTLLKKILLVLAR